VSASPLRFITRGSKVAAAVGEFGLRHHGVAVRAFEPLLARFGRRAGLDLLRVERALGAGLASGGDACAGEAWAALGRLSGLALKLPPGDEQIRVGIEIERRMQALLARDAGYAKAYAEASAEAAAKLREKAARRALAAARRTGAKAPKITPAAKVIADLDAVVGDRAELRRLWAHFQRVVPPSSAAMARAAEVAAERADAVSAILRDRRLTPAERTAAVWGHLSKVRGELGEGYALGNVPWRRLRDAERARVEAIAARLGPGLDVLSLTQLEHGVRINGSEGPDAVIVIVNRKQGVAYDPLRVQVKTADTSEAVDQTINDVLRSAGLEARTGPLPTVVYEFRATSDGPIEHFVLSAHPDVETRNVIINAADASLPYADMARLRGMGLTVSEQTLDLSVEQFTHLAVSLMETALKAAKAR
jgi:hypothetical protein